jgi:twitching motility protein PilT
MAIVQTAELERFLQDAFDKGASDLFLIPHEPPTFRIKGSIERTETDALRVEDICKMAAAAFGEEQIKLVGSQTGQLVTSCSLPGVVDGRMCLARSRGGFTIVVRLLPTNLPDVSDLRIPEGMLSAALSQNGLVICAGPSGSGKTTTLYGLAEYINEKHASHICTVENPICYRIRPKKAIVQQREVGSDIPDVVAGINAATKQDLDVLLLGEIKTAEELAACVTVTQTGHLVLSQVHAWSPETAIQRLIDVQAEENLAIFRRHFAEALRAVSAQVLLPKAAGKGLVAAYGVLVPDKQMRKAIAEGRDIFDRKDPLPKGCQRLADDIERLYSEGVIAEESRNNALADLK